MVLGISHPTVSDGSRYPFLAFERSADLHSVLAVSCPISVVPNQTLLSAQRALTANLNSHQEYDSGRIVQEWLRNKPPILSTRNEPKFSPRLIRHF